MLTIANTLTGKKENFVPLNDKKVKLYVCGITPYDYAHIGHARVYVTFDLLYRLLTFEGFQVSYCRNFTDIDDKILNRAQKEFGDASRYQEISKRYIDAFHEDMRKLNCLPPTYEPTVTGTMPEIIEFIQGLIKNGKAYQVNGDVYFSIDSFPDYGKLSKRKLDELEVGARVQVNEEKRNPLDFALWKSEPEGTFWKSPWGWGRPGWHIECSAMASKYLGNHIDIHAGGLDLIFPHHENEIAQSEGLHGAPFARYWMHNGFVTINHEKMSKSLGNFFTLRDVFKQYDPMVIRYYILAHHYKAPLEFSTHDIDAVQKSYQKLCKFFDPIACAALTPAQVQQSPIAKQMIDFLTDDLNTPGMFGVLFEHLHELQKNTRDLCAAKYVLTDILGLTLKPLPEKAVEMTPEIEQLLKEREQARTEKNWARADKLRDQLKALGFDVHDKKS
jgi:cysteinyl-tRNA synthetase